MSLFFALGILLPSLFLGYLGIRSYRTETQLMHKESEERFAVVADLIEAKVSQRAAGLLANLRSLAGAPTAQPVRYAPWVPFLLERHELDQLPVEGFFIFDENARMAAPWPPPNQRALPVSPGKDFDWGPIADDIERVERIEFAQRNIPAALQGYKALQARKWPPPIQAELLKSIAGAYRKMNQPRLAVTTYLQLARQYEDLEDLTGAPMAVLGRQMAIDLYESGKRVDNALEVRLDLFEGLLRRRWNLTDAERANLLENQRGAILRLLSLKTAPAPEQSLRWQRLQSMQARLRSLSLAGERFAKNDWPELLRRVRGLGRLDQGAVVDLAASQPPKTAVMIPLVDPRTGRWRGFLVAVCPAAQVWRSFDDVMRASAKPAGLAVEWIHGAAPPSPHGRLWRMGLEREIPSVDPPIRFRLVESERSAQNEQFRRRQWIFSGMTGLSFIVIVAGLLLSYHATQREVEIANLKSDFVANVSHELRTPLAAISHAGERLRLERFRSDEERRRTYQILDRETNRLKQLVDDVLDFSKVMAGKTVYQKEPLDLVSLVQESVQAFLPKAESRGFQVAPAWPSHPVRILGDDRALRQSVVNLLDNAMKYSGNSRKIDVCVRSSPPHAIIAVKDYGIGIEDGDQEKIYEKFYRVERGPQGRTAGGVGLGLAMVKHAAEGHGGKIVLESRAGQGSTFSLFLPLEPGAVS